MTALYRVTASHLNVRPEPTLATSVLATLPAGFVVKVGGLAAGGLFREVEAHLVDGVVKGYCASAYLDPLSSPGPEIPPWMRVAMGEIGVREYEGPADNPRIVAYHAETSLRASDDEVSWCSSFANWCMKQAGLKGTGSAAARSWLKWGVPAEARLGAVVVLRRGSQPWQGHVTNLLEQEGGRLICLGGNQGNSVKVSSFPVSDLLGMRWPA